MLISCFNFTEETSCVQSHNENEDLWCSWCLDNDLCVDWNNCDNSTRIECSKFVADWNNYSCELNFNQISGIIMLVFELFFIFIGNYVMIRKKFSLQNSKVHIALIVSLILGYATSMSIFTNIIINSLTDNLGKNIMLCFTLSFCIFIIFYIALSPEILKIMFCRKIRNKCYRYEYILTVLNWILGIGLIFGIMINRTMIQESALKWSDIVLQLQIFALIFLYVDHNYLFLSLIVKPNINQLTLFLILELAIILSSICFYLNENFADRWINLISWLVLIYPFIKNRISIISKVWLRTFLDIVAIFMSGLCVYGFIIVDTQNYLHEAFLICLTLLIGFKFLYEYSEEHSYTNQEDF